MRAGWESWSLEVLPDWMVEDDPDCLTIYHPNGVGAFQLSSGKKKEGNVTLEDLEFYSKPEWGQYKNCEFGEFNGHVYTFIKDNSFWCWWILANGPVLLRATYNSEASDKDIEIPKIEQMLQTLKREQNHA